jgi:phenol 2-monooxygenase (NADPH)
VLSQRVGISRFQQAVIHQGEIERSILQLLAQTSRIRVERNAVPEELDLNDELLESRDEYPITVKIRHAEYPPGKSTDPVNGRNGKIWNNPHQSEGDAREEFIKAKYIIGCDGAHSWTRDQLGISLEGEQTDHVWGVMDIVPLTDFREGMPVVE